jgi:hypothetical protein
MSAPERLVERKIPCTYLGCTEKCANLAGLRMHVRAHARVDIAGASGPPAPAPGAQPLYNEPHAAGGEEHAAELMAEDPPPRGSSSGSTPIRSTPDVDPAAPLQFPYTIRHPIINGMHRSSRSLPRLT